MFRWKKSVTKPRGRWEDAVIGDAVDLFRIPKWKAAIRNRVI